MNADITRTEELVASYGSGGSQTLASWRDRQSKDDVLLGVALEAGLSVKLSERWFAGITAGYEWIEDADVAVGPDTVALDLSGFSTSAVIGVRF